MAIEDIDELDAMLVVVITDDRMGDISFAVRCSHHVDPTRRILMEHGIPNDAMSVGIFVGGSLREPPEYECIPQEVVDLDTGVSVPGFGGYYVEDGFANIYLLDPSQQELGETIIRDELDNSWVSQGRVRVLKATHTWERLWEWYSLLWDAPWRESANIWWVALDPKHNRIELRGERGASDGLDVQMIDEGLSTLGIPCNAVFLNENDIEASGTEFRKITDRLSKTTLCDAVASLEQ